MWPYWTLFALLAIGALFGMRQQVQPVPAVQSATGLLPGSSPMPPSPLFVLISLLLLVVIGLRLEVGGDWHNYEAMLAAASRRSLEQQLTLSDPGYQLLNWVVAGMGGEMWWVNLIAAIPFVIGLHRLAKLQAEPWLVLVVAAPYLIVVVGMGYTRQATAIGFVMIGLAAVMKGAGLYRFALYVLLAALFHRTAIVFLPLMAFVFPQSRAGNILLIGSLTLALYAIFLQEDVEALRKNYLEARYSSQGAAIRIAQLGLAALLFVIFRTALRFPALEDRIWRNLSWVSLATVPVLVLSPSSTVVDRLSLYLLPLQLAVLARLPYAVSPPPLVRLLVMFYSATVLFVWLNFAAHRRVWVPYDNVLFAG